MDEGKNVIHRLDEPPTELPPLTEEDLGIDLSDEKAQRVADHNAIYEAIGRTRSMLARSKVNHRLAHLGVIRNEHGQGIHPNQLKDTIRDQRETLDRLKAMLGELTETGLPEPSNIEVAAVAGLPTSGR